MNKVDWAIFATWLFGAGMFVAGVIFGRAMLFRQLADDTARRLEHLS